MNKDLRIVFMGTPDFAVASLKALVDNKYNVVGVLTAPDRPAGRGRKLTASAVKEYALSQKIPVLQPLKFKNDEFLAELSALRADLQIVVAFRMLPEVVWDMPTKGTFNLHASLLPQYRGAAPINWAIINGEKETGVSTFFIEKEIDTGNIMLQEKVTIAPNETAGSLHDKLMTVGADLILKTVDLIESGDVKTIDQDELFTSEADLKPAPKIFKEDCKIDWSDSIENINNKIRGLSPYPCAWTEFKKKEEILSLKLYKAEIVSKEAYKHLKINSDNKTFIEIETPNGKLNLLEIHLAGKKRMDVKSFLAGADINDYTLV